MLRDELFAPAARVAGMLPPEAGTTFERGIAALPLAAALPVGAGRLARAARVETGDRRRAEPDALIGRARRHADGAAR